MALKHLKIFEQHESEGEVLDQQEFVEKPELLPETDATSFPAISWTPIMEGEGEYLITFTTPAGEVSAEFKEAKSAPIMNPENGGAEGIFEMLPGTSSDGKNYIARFHYQHVRVGDLEVVMVDVILHN